MAGALFGRVGASFFVAGASVREILGIAGGRSVVFFHTKCVSEMGQVRSRERRVRDHGRIILESTLYWRKQFMDFPVKS